MYFKVDQKIFNNFPEFRLGLIIALDIDNNKQQAATAELLKKTINHFKNHFDKNSFDNHPFIQVWHEAYETMGVNPKDHCASIKNMGLRLLKGGDIRSISPLVDLYNVISLKYLLPIGGQDLKQIFGDIHLTYATENEEPAILLGEKEEKKPIVGEIFYKDSKGALCRRWNWKEAERTKITNQTNNAIFEIEALSPVQTLLLQDALNELAVLIKKYCGGTITHTIIDKNNPEICVEKNGQYFSFTQPGLLSEVDWHIYSLVTDASLPADISDETHIRIEKVEKMRAQGIDPWPPAKDVPNNCKEILTEFGTEKQRTEYTIAGRLMSIRVHGKTIFADLQDPTCTLQLYLRKDAVGQAAFDQFQQFIDIGDIVWISGSVFRTKMGEITLEVTKWELLSKCLHPLPDKFHGLADIELRYRQRYFDLICNQESKKKFMVRSSIVRSLRTFLDSHGFLEVETPMLHPIAGGAAARPFITHHNALDSDFYLRIAPELYLKRLVVGGFERVYEINRNFRNEGVSTRHNPEFTMAEFYMAHHDYHFAMQFVEQLFRDVIQKSCETLQVPFGEHIIDFSKPFKRISIHDSVVEIGGIAAHDLIAETIDQTLKKHGIQKVSKSASLAQKIYALFEECVEKKLINPTYIIDFPIEVSPLAKRDRANTAIAARFELFVGGMELSNGFNELNDPFDQAERFKQQLEAHRAGDEEAHQYDADYIQALEYGLPPTVGVGIGIDRLVMLATNTTSIKDVILFPTLKKKHE